MTWTKITDTFVTDPDIISLPVPMRYLVVEALVYSNTHLTDGRITEAALLHLTRHPDTQEAASRLVAAGLWAEHSDGGWQIVRYLDDQRPRAEVEAEREANRQRQAQWRQVQRAHARGDHSTCSSNCRARNAVTNGVTNAVTNGVSHTPPDLSSPVLSRKGSGHGLRANAAPPDGGDIDSSTTAATGCTHSDCDGYGWHNTNGKAQRCPTWTGQQ